MSEQRIERWALIDNDGDVYTWSTRAEAVQNCEKGVHIIRLVEIRDGEPHPDELAERNAVLIKRVNELMEQAENWQKNMWDATHALIERAEKAESEAEIAAAVVHARDAEIDTLRSILKQFEDGGMSGREVREAQNDAAAKFERWAAVRFHAVSLAQGDGDFSAIVEARKFRSHYFGAKEV